MRLLDKLTAQPSQRYTVVTETGDQFTLELRFLPSQSSWMASIEWGDFSLRGTILVLSPNLLFGYQNILPFGIMVTSTDTIDPAYLDDFTSGRIKVYVMTAADVDELNGVLSA